MTATPVLKRYEIPVALVAKVFGFNSHTDASTALGVALSAGFDAVEDRLNEESSVTVFDSLDEVIAGFPYDIATEFDVLYDRHTEIRLKLTAKEYFKTEEEFVLLCLAQRISQ